MRFYRHVIASAMTLAVAVVGAPAPVGLADATADLQVQLWHHDPGSRDVQIAVSINGGGSSPSTTLNVQTLAPGSSSGTGLKTFTVPALDQNNRRFVATYQLAQACAPGVRAQAEVKLDSDPVPSNNLIVFTPCQPDLQIAYDKQVSDQVIQFRIGNIGGEDAPATTVHFETVGSPPRNLVDVPLPALGVRKSTRVTYTLDAPCPGLKVRATVAVAQDGDTSDNTVELYPCQPDLEVSFVRYVDVSRDLAFEVANVGGVAAPTATASAVKVAPSSAAGGARQFSVPTLKPGERFGFTYNIGSAPCPAGLQVRASAALDVDADPSNNSVTQTVCASIGGLNPGLTANMVRKPDFTTGLEDLVAAPVSPSRSEDLLHPERAPGVHTLDFSPNASQARTQDTNPGDGGIFGCLVGAMAPPDGPPVGWRQTGWGGGCVSTSVAQTAVRFDMTQLDQVPTKDVSRATLTFDESPYQWTNADGSQRSVPGCVAVLGIATSDWAAGNPPDGLFPNATVVDFRPWPSDRQDFSGHEFDVTGWVQAMYLPTPSGPFGVPGVDLSTAKRFGWVLRGAIEGLNGDDLTSCESSIANIQLHVTYSVPPRG